MSAPRLQAAMGKRPEAADGAPAQERKNTMKLLRPVPAQLFLSLLGLIGAADAILTMTVDAGLAAWRFPSWARAAADAVLLMAVCSPMLLVHCRRLAWIAYHDDLTGLPNRVLFLDRLGQGIALARRSDRYCALVFMDLDRFKPVNDTYGHHVGDMLLKAVAGRLRQCVRESDMVARLGGDEFTLILGQVGERGDIEGVVRKIIAELSRPFCVHGSDVRLDVSMGIAVYPDDGKNGERLLKAADVAMYRAKQSGGSAYCFADGPV